MKKKMNRRRITDAPDSCYLARRARRNKNVAFTVYKGKRQVVTYDMIARERNRKLFNFVFVGAGMACLVVLMYVVVSFLSDCWLPL